MKTTQAVVRGLLEYSPIFKYIGRRADNNVRFLEIPTGNFYDIPTDVYDSKAQILTLTLVS